VFGHSVTPGSLASAEDYPSRFGLRGSVASAVMLSHDQRGYLNYQPPGVLADLAAEYHPNDWLGLQLGVVSGVFLSGAPAGGLVAPMLGAIARIRTRALQPFIALDVGAGFTGHLVRPFGRALLGFDAPVGEQWRIGPQIGLDVITQRNGTAYSSDAIYAWFGLSASYRFVTDVTPPATLPSERTVAIAPRPASPGIADQPPPSAARTEPSPALDALLDTAIRHEEPLHVARSELLAPLLFAFDSVELEPSSVAMLHEVARLLTHERSDLARLQIVAYADARGGAEYNRRLAERRAERVLEWLVTHGVARERLETSALGAVDLVEPGESANEHQQNRRVIFRELDAPPSGAKP
jgi:outer membrane protein OmpA-like peptidoglycan-associated protein